ncbi:hypothetical protein BK026_11995 [Alteromonas sp. V450]|uniref:hypothetical protein n=1 Tax=Alteromonas sp. V450 TaxID=1912139 RepID=UPI0008FF4D6B|nr:hypothetical protein [Alteromonas sp. V450]OJF69449.1 hypothetical protein BK026_11995 [Alteromonas sp. V450]
MILITSGEYIQEELIADIGYIPPSFLPIGNKRLYELQVVELKTAYPDDKIFMSLPADFVVQDHDRDLLNALGVEIIYSPKGLSLGNAVLYSWNAAAHYDNNLIILHGDTLIQSDQFPATDAISVNENLGFYNRARLLKSSHLERDIVDSLASNNEDVLSGFFYFSKPLHLMRALVEHSGCFTTALKRYNECIGFDLFTKGIWLDFGHVNSFYHSRTRITTQRNFNELEITQRFVNKSSPLNSRKIEAEGTWFANLPLGLKIYTPHLLEKNVDNYKLEYLYLLPLSDLFVFGCLPKLQWDCIFDAVWETREAFDKYKAPSDFNVKGLDSLYLEKTLERISELQSQTTSKRLFESVDKDAADLTTIARTVSSYIRPCRKTDVAITHGDFCFSNILYDSKVQIIKCIDPRGTLPTGEISCFGDRRYDIAKLYHSVIGKYDHIIAGQYSLSEKAGKVGIEFSTNREEQAKIEESFRKKIIVKSGYEEREIIAITILLFLSMLPLHADRLDRQTAFVANAIRLYEKLKEC